MSCKQKSRVTIIYTKTCKPASLNPYAPCFFSLPLKKANCKTALCYGLLSNASFPLHGSAQLVSTHFCHQVLFSILLSVHPQRRHKSQLNAITVPCETALTSPLMRFHFHLSVAAQRAWNLDFANGKPNKNNAVSCSGNGFRALQLILGDVSYCW